MQPSANGKAVASYLKAIADRYGAHSMRVGGKQAGARLTSSVSDVYIPLRLTQLGAAPPTHHSSPLLSDRSKRNRAAIFQAIQAHRLIVILGDPGSGKSTLLRHVTLEVATSSPKSQSFIPFFVSAADLASLPDASSSSLIELIPAAVRKSIPVSNVAQMFELALANGKALVLIDGLDEVGNATARAMLATKIEDFVSFIRESNNRSMLTSRKVAYTPMTDVADLTVEFELEEFEDEDVVFYIDTIRRLLREKRQQGSLQADATADAENKLDQLRQLLFQSSAIRELARSPLTLTLMCDSRIRLGTGATHIGDLLEQLVSTRLTPTPRRRQVPEHASTDAEVIGFCQYVAATVHRQQTGLVKLDSARLRSLYESYSGDRRLPPPVAFPEIIAACEGLLVAKGMDQYAFTHLAFQEYFAARNLVFLSSAEEVMDAFSERISQAYWQNYCQLVAYCVAVVKSDDELTRRILSKCFEETRSSGPYALSLLEVLMVSLPPHKVAPEFKREVQAWLLDQQHNSESKVRARCLSALGAIGDPRSHLIEVSEMLFVSVPSGTLRLNATGDQATTVPAFYAGQWTVTNSQFKQFVEEAYQIEQFWTERGWAWLQSVRRSRPMVATRFANPNQPVIAVSWHEAIAFSNWITLHARNHGWISPESVIRLPTEVEWLCIARGNQSAGYHAAPLSGLSELNDISSWNPNPNSLRAFPWGDSFAPELVNSAEAGFAYPLCAGVLGSQKSPYGAELLAGNIWEWLTTAWGRGWENSSYPLEANLLGDDRDSLLHPDEVLRMVKGGSFMDHEGRPHFNIDYRTRNRPDGRYTNHGFRLVIARSVLSVH